MSGKLEKWISDNRELFDEPLPHGHTSRFAEKLKNRSDKKAVYPGWGKAAAVILLFFSIGWAVIHSGKESGARETIAETAMVNSEIQEAEMFFAMQIKARKQEVITEAGNDPETEQALKELEKLEKQYEELKEELVINPGNERIIAAMIENYRLRLSILEKLLDQIRMKNIKTKKYKNNIQA